MIRGSYYNGFAPRDGMPMYPSLWRGCVGAWAPCLGPSGLTLRDWSAYKNHGTLTNMDPNTDWIISGGRYCLDFDGTNDGVPTTLSTLSGDFTLSCWIFRRSGSQQVFIGKDISGSRNFTVWVNFAEAGTTTTGTVTFFNNVTGSNADAFGAESNVTPLNTWTHIAITRQGTTGSTFANGLLIRSKSAITASGFTGSSVINFGRRAFVGFENPFDGQLDDVLFYNRALSPNEIALLASRRGIAYDLAPFAMPYSEQVATAARFRRLLLLGVGS